MRARHWVLGALAAAWGLSAGCANTRDVAGRVDGNADAAPPSFAGTDGAAGDPQDAGKVLTAYCASNRCTEPYTTCPGSRFPCDVNLSNDPENCGGCGVSCRSGLVLGGQFQCIAGKCVLVCTTSPSRTADCDGIPDNGCETNLGSDDNCTACGDTCEADTPCVVDTASHSAKCGCDPGLTYCSASFPNHCVDTQADDANCGECKTACPVAGDGGPLPPHAHYGCVGGACGHLKCDGNYADCDGDIAAPDGNGCETYLLATESCGGCNVACDPGQSCAVEFLTKAIKCMCAPGQKNCGTAQNPSCVDIASDPFNCGGCGISCNAPFVATGLKASHFVTACDSGSCSFGCEAGWADCNGRLDDGCEVNTDFDPENCGGCGNVCDGIAGQACTSGRCTIEPCQGEGPEAK